MDELETAVAAARRAQPSWAARSWEERAAALENFVKTIETNVERLAHLFTLEQGRPLAGARIEIGLACRYTRLLAAVRLPSRVLVDNEVRRVTERCDAKRRRGCHRAVERTRRTWHGENCHCPHRRQHDRHQAVGANAALYPRAWSTRPEGFPAGRSQRGLGGPRGWRGFGRTSRLRQNLLHPESTATGRSIAGKAGTLLRPVTLELGGNDAAILLPDGSIEAMTTAATLTGLANCGQFCGAV